MTPPTSFTKTPANRASRPAAFAGGLLALALAAGCGSSGSGKVAGRPPSSTPAASPSSTPTDFPGPSSATTAVPSATGSTDSLREFDDATTGLSFTAPEGYVVATTPAEAASRFPAVLGTGAETSTKITDAQNRLRSSTIMIAYHTAIGGLYDNVGVIKETSSAADDPASVQSPTTRSQIRNSLTKAGAKNVVFSDTKLGGQPAESSAYSIVSGVSALYGEQFYVVSDKNVFIMTITAGTAARAKAAADEIVSTWTFQ